MDKSQQVPGHDLTTIEDAEMSIEPHRTQGTDLSSNAITSNTCCAHQRVIDDVLTRGKKRTGKVRCLECGTIFNDPYQSVK